MPIFFQQNGEDSKTPNISECETLEAFKKRLDFQETEVITNLFLNNLDIHTDVTVDLDVQFASCNSSSMSVCSDSHDSKTTFLDFKSGIDCTSESESSTMSTDRQQRLGKSPSKNRSRLTTETNQTKSICTDIVSKNRIRAAAGNRGVNQRTSGALILATTERRESRDRQKTPNLQLSPKKRLKPTLSLPENSEQAESEENSQKKIPISRRPSSVSRGTPTSNKIFMETEDGRWPSNQFRSMINVQGRNKNEMLVIKSKIGPIMLTKIRKKKVKSEEDLSSSIEAKERMFSSTIVKKQSTRRSPPRYQKTTSKTRIYHEASIQTTLAGQILDKPQIDTHGREIHQLKQMIEAMDAENQALRLNLTERSQSLTFIENQLKQEREEKAAMEKVFLNEEPNTDESHNPLILKPEIQHSDHKLEEKQAEIYKLRQFCDQLQVDMNKSIQMNRSILEEKKCFEKETLELQDFLQDEKAVINEALRDAENDIECLVEKLKQKEKEIDRLEDECRHLVRISEQRRLFIILTLVSYN